MLWMYLSTRLVFPPYSFPSSTTFKSTLPAMMAAPKMSLLHSHRRHRKFVTFLDVLPLAEQKYLRLDRAAVYGKFYGSLDMAVRLCPGPGYRLQGLAGSIPRASTAVWR